MQARIAIICSMLALAGCVKRKQAPRVVVVPSGTGVAAAPKPPGCSIPMLRNAPSDRPYDELAAIYYKANFVSDPAEANAFIRDSACEAGADAALVTQEFIPGVPGQYGYRPSSMAALAIRFRPVSGVTGSGPATP
jgi:hypothetical protein